MKKLLLLSILVLFSGEFLFSQSPVPTLKPEVAPARNYDKEFKIWEEISHVIYDDTAISEFFFDGIDVNCLAEGTRITMGDGSSKNIESITEGDKVLSYDEAANKSDILSVVRVHNVAHDEVVRLTLSNGNEIVTTADHPFLSTNGWCSLDPAKTKAYGRYANVSKYKVDTELIILGKNNQTETVTISAISKLKQPTNTYTLELEKEGAFIANGVLVGQE